MADRTSAGLFEIMFTELAKMEPTDQVCALVRQLWERKNDYDFSNYQIGCDEALKVLGLAKMGIDSEYPEDGEMLLYAELDGTFKELLPLPLTGPVKK